eukprot:SM000038S14298  [mRNA]  locus=s38:128851:133870:+ [translate_table: standard]
MAAPDVVKTLAWAGPAAERLCLAIRREYVILDVHTGTVSNVFPSGYTASPLVVHAGGNLLLGKDSISVLVDWRGRPIGHGGLSWSEAPLAVAVVEPYALGLLSRFIEVRSLDPPHALVQTLAVRGVTVLAANEAGVLAASESTVWRLLPVPLGVQVSQLAGLGKFEEALALCQRLPPEDAALRASEEDSIHKRYGQQLFQQGDFVAAMEQYDASSMDLVSLLSLFPSLILPRRALAVLGAAQVLKGQEQASVSVSGLSPANIRRALLALAGSLKRRRRAVVERVDAEETSQMIKEVLEGGQGESKSGSMGLNSEDGATAEGPSIARAAAIVLDTALLQVLLETEVDTASAAPFLHAPNYCDVATCRSFLEARGGSRQLLVQLYKANGLHQEALQLLHDQVEGAATTKQLTALLDYLKGLGPADRDVLVGNLAWLLQEHPEQGFSLLTSIHPPLPPDIALQQLKQFAPQLQSSYLEAVLVGSSANGVDTPQRELQTRLILLHLKAVLREANEGDSSSDRSTMSDARKKLVAALSGPPFLYDAVSILPHFPKDKLFLERSLIFAALQQHYVVLVILARKLEDFERAVAYCDQVPIGEDPRKPQLVSWPVDEVGFPGHKLHMMLLKIYVQPASALTEYDRIVDGIMEAVVGQTRPDSRRMEAIRQDFTESDKSLIKVEPRARTLHVESGKLEAFSNRLDNEEGLVGANEDVGNDWTSGKTFRGDVMLEKALRLLDRRWSTLNMLVALAALPGEVNLQRLLAFLQPKLLKDGDTRHNSAVVRSQVLQLQRRFVLLTEDSTCDVCHKRIGLSAFAVSLGGALVHFVCSQAQLSG